MENKETKQCSKCGEVKSVKEFSFRDKKQKIRQTFCKLCKSKRAKQYYQENKEVICEKSQKYYAENKEAVAKSQKMWGQKNKEKRHLYHKRYRENNREEITERHRRYTRERVKTDIQFKLQRSLRSRLRWVIKDGVKSGSAVRDLGCSVDELKSYLENQFYPNPETGEMMTWDNWSYHGWHIDHIKPLCAFDLEDREQLKEACHYTNLQPLWARENLSKSGKYDK